MDPTDTKKFLDSRDTPRSREGELWRVFNFGFQNLLDPESASGLSFLAFIRWGLKQFRLDSFYSADDVLSEVYTRAYRLIHDEHIEIINLPAWAKRVAFNIIREWSRRERRFEALDALDREVTDESVHLSVDSSAVAKEIRTLLQAWQELDPDEQKLLQLKIVEELPWQEISSRYALENKTISESALRKKKERALKHLRKIYHSLHPLEEAEE